VIVQPQITSSEDVYQLLLPTLADVKHEETWILLLNRANKVLKKIQVSKGGIAGTIIDIRMIMKKAIDSLASAMILCHNHPSGNNKPSGDDDQITKRLKEAGSLMDIRLLDHVIICEHSYYSYMDEGKL
jgi:DNA repair protein RadC